ncbi:ureidoglycolate dehydrogenase [Sinobaca sp. H24]|uniref:ureidoglycolate dehydrogenase n=1 Tax=Sinobaca sp. H24 TaxID=2923376 RepID=UPI002079FC8C|nr:ureidoglycolate dehydrogenase [Sinobaca sp. H24]
MPDVAWLEVKEKTQRKLRSQGIGKNHAATIADVLIHADLRNVSSHGVLRLEHYIKRLQSGGLNTSPDITFKQTGYVTGVMDGDGGFGHVVAEQAMDEAIRLAEENGVGVVTAFNSSHCGALSYFVNRAANKGLIGVALTHTDKAVVPFGGKESFLGTNPIAVGAPALKENSFIFDMATSNAALGKILKAVDKNENIPGDWGVDKNGSAVTNPRDVVSLLPFGGPKGYGLGVVVDIFSGLLAGAAFGPHINKMYGDLDKKRELGHFFCALDPSYFTDKQEFLKNMDQMILELRNAPAKDGVERVFVPGELEQMNEERNRIEGITLSEETFNYLNSDS